MSNWFCSDSYVHPTTPPPVPPTEPSLYSASRKKGMGVASISGGEGFAMGVAIGAIAAILVLAALVRKQFGVTSGAYFKCLNYFHTG